MLLFFLPVRYSFVSGEKTMKRFAFLVVLLFLFAVPIDFAIANVAPWDEWRLARQMHKRKVIAKIFLPACVSIMSFEDQRSEEAWRQVGAAFCAQCPSELRGVGSADDIVESHMIGP